MTRIPNPAQLQAWHPQPWTLGSTPWRRIAPPARPRARVIIDNDFSGDPDDLFQLVHHVLSPGVDIRLVVASHLRHDDPFDPSGRSAENAEVIARDVFARMGLQEADIIVPGSNIPLSNRREGQPAPAVDAIVKEAMREDASPLFYAAGGGLTDIASAYLLEPRIADRITLVWIGGAEHDGLGTPPPHAPAAIEYNQLIDPIAAQVIFNDSALPIWQVPRDVYRQCLVSDAELRLRVAATGPLGRYLYDEVAYLVQAIGHHLGGAPEAYALGDSPLVLLTALQVLFEPDSSSSRYMERSTPALADDGTYCSATDARLMRVYTHVDTRLMFEDFYLKLSEFDEWQTQRP